MTGFAFTDELLLAVARWLVRGRAGAEQRWRADRWTGLNEAAFRARCQFEMQDIAHGQRIYHVTWNVYVTRLGDATFLIENESRTESYTLMEYGLYLVLRKAVDVGYPEVAGDADVQERLF